MQAVDYAKAIWQAATPIIKITQLGGSRWRRNDATVAARTGPWLSANYEVLNRNRWEEKTPSIYFVAGDDEIIKYTGISRNRVRDRWRECPAIDVETGLRRTRTELHHSQCWKHIEREYALRPGSVFEIRCISAALLLPVVINLGPPLSGFAPLASDQEGLIAAVERWLCNNRSESLVPWNVAMTFQRA